jgi:signal peptidase
MEPTLYRGDIIFLWNRTEQVHVGDITVVWFSGRELPMVHRTIEVKHEDRWNVDRIVTKRHVAALFNRTQERANVNVNRQLILTKGDNNEVDDVALYPNRRQYVYRDEVVGVVKGHIPLVGKVNLLMNDHVWALYIVIATAFFVGLYW